jgi:ribosomal protein S18 acetylase RimI-like enzyme
MGSEGHEPGGSGGGFRIRPATRADAAFLARIIHTAGRSHGRVSSYDYLFPGTLEDRLAAMERLTLARELTPFHYSGFRVAEADGTPAAALTAFSPRRVSVRRVVLALEETGWDFDHIAEAAERLAAIQATTAAWPDPESGWVIEHVATLPEFRRRGLADRLLAEAIEEGRRAGCSPIQLTLLIGNEPARRAYEKHGFEIVGEKRSAEFEALTGAPGVWRMWLGGDPERKFSD